MKKEFTLGRSRENDIVIHHNEVSRKHLLIIYLNDKEFMIEDHDSHNHTVVNGHRVKRARIYPSDTILLGTYQLDTDNVFAEVIKLYNADRNDYSGEFLELKRIYMEYERKVHELKKKSQAGPLMVKTGVTLGAILAAFILIKDPQFRYPVMMLAGLAGGLFALSFQKDTKYRDQLDILNARLEEEFRCPKCKKNLAGRRWQHWAERKKCDGCGAIWVL